ncbi:hypothetical protein LQW54_002074 [Pestalotiopsis sp. IQ-011]
MTNDAIHTLPPIKTKPPQPARPDSPSLVTLGYDITPLVIDELWISSRRTLLSVALLARYSRHRTVTLRLRNGQSKSVDPRDDGDRAEQSTDLLKWLDQAIVRGLLPAIRSLSVKMDRNQGGGEDNMGKQARNTLAGHLTHMSGLVDFYWRGNETLPDQVIQVMSDRPGLRLHVSYKRENRLPDDSGENPHEKPLSRLLGLANLKSLSINASYTTSRQCQDIMQPVKDVLLSCTNLRRLKLYMHCWPFDRNEYTGFDFINGGRPAAALRDLELISYPFRHETAIIPQHLLLPGTPYYERTEESYWADTFDWSCLERLEVSSPYLACKMLPYLKSLRHVAMLAPLRGLAKEFFSQLPDGLETIRVSSINDIGIDALLRHGSTLRKLRMSQFENYGSDRWSQNAVQETAITRIRDACVVLEDLDVDVGRGGDDWPYTMLDIIASFPRLRRLGLRFEIGSGDLRNPVKPYVTASAARHIFDYVLSKSTVTPSRLRSIVIHLGQPLGEIPISRMRPTRINSPAVFQCHVSDRDDDAPPHTYEFKAAYLTWEGAQSD